MATSTFRNKNMVRPKKKGADKRRRCMIQRRRLVALGLSEETVGKLQTHQVRDMLKRPKKVEEYVARGAAKAEAEA